MKTPTESELLRILTHWGAYNPWQAHLYYEEHKHLKGRHGKKPPPPPKGRQHAPAGSRKHHGGQHTVRAKQKEELQKHITSLEGKLQQLEFLIKKKEAVLAKNARRNTAGKAKGPKTAAQKANQARKNKQYRQAHKQTLKNKARAAKGKSGGGKHQGQSGTQLKQKSIKDLKALATKVKGQLAVAKQKLAAL